MEKIKSSKVQFGWIEKTFGEAIKNQIVEDIRCDLCLELLSPSEHKQGHLGSKSWGADCIIKWFGQSKTCPNGRQNIKVDELRQDRTLDLLIKFLTSYPIKNDFKHKGKTHYNELEAYGNQGDKNICGKGMISKEHKKHEFISQDDGFEKFQKEQDIYLTEVAYFLKKGIHIIYSKSLFNDIKNDLQIQINATDLNQYVDSKIILAQITKIIGNNYGALDPLLNSEDFEEKLKNGNLINKNEFLKHEDPWILLKIINAQEIVKEDRNVGNEILKLFKRTKFTLNNDQVDKFLKNEYFNTVNDAKGDSMSYYKDYIGHHFKLKTKLKANGVIGMLVKTDSNLVFIRSQYFDFNDIQNYETSIPGKVLEEEKIYLNKIFATNKDITIHWNLYEIKLEDAFTSK